MTGGAAVQSRPLFRKEGEAPMRKLVFNGTEMKELEPVETGKAKKEETKAKAGKTSNKAGKAENK